MRSNVWKGLVLSLLLAPALAVPLAALSPDRVDAWREDLEFLAREAPAQHPDFFHSLSRESWERELDALSRALPEMAPHEVVVELARIVAAVGDGHTRLTLPLAPGVDFFRGHSETPPPRDPALLLRQLPIRLGLFEDGLFVTAVEPRNRQLYSARVVRIGGLSAEDATAAVAPTIQRDNEMGVRLRLPERLVLPEVLHARGVTDSPDRAVFTVERTDGAEVPVTLDAVPAGESVGWAEIPQLGPGSRHLRHPERKFWLDSLPDFHALYVRLGECSNEDDETLRELAERVLEATRGERVRRVILDLRGNPGGDNSLNRPLLHALIRSEKLREPGRLFVLIDRGTFSAALMLTVDLERHTPAVFVGEPTGGKPNHFGDSRKLELPRSGLTVRISSLEWQYSSPRDDRPWVPPHLPVAVTSEDFFRGADPELAAVIGGVSEVEELRASRWQGSLSFGPLRLDAALELERAGDGWSARVDVPDLGLEDRKVTDLHLGPHRLAFEFPTEQGALRFEGRIEEGWVVGRLLQEGREIGVFLRGSV